MSCSLRLQELICFVSSVMMPCHSEVQCLRCLRCLHPGFRLFPQARSKNWFEASVASDRRLLSICDVAGNGPGKEVGGSNDVMTLERMIFVAVMFHVSNHFCTPKEMYKAQTHGVLQWPCLLSGVLVGGLGTTLARRVLWDAQVVRNSVPISIMAVWLDVGDPVVAPLQTLIGRHITEQGKQENRKDQAPNLPSYSKDMLPLF